MPSFQAAVTCAISITPLLQLFLAEGGGRESTWGQTFPQPPVRAAVKSRTDGTRAQTDRCTHP